MPTEVEATIRTEENSGPGRRGVERRLASALLVALVSAGLSLAQRPPGRPGWRRQAQGKVQKPRQPRKDQHQHSPNFMKQLQDLPPAVQERVLANDERFQNLPPERKKQIRENLRRWNALSPEDKQRMRERQEILEGLSPAKREQARAVFQHWHELPPGRRQELMKAFRNLRDLPPEARQQYLSEPENQKRFSPEEREILGGMSRLLPETPGDPPGESE